MTGKLFTIDCEYIDSVYTIHPIRGIHNAKDIQSIKDWIAHYSRGGR